MERKRQLPTARRLYGVYLLIGSKWRWMKYKDFWKSDKVGSAEEEGWGGGGTIASRGWRGQVQQVHKLCCEDFNPSPWPQDTASVCESEISVRVRVCVTAVRPGVTAAQQSTALCWVALGKQRELVALYSDCPTSPSTEKERKEPAEHGGLRRKLETAQQPGVLKSEKMS